MKVAMRSISGICAMLMNCIFWGGVDAIISGLHTGPFALAVPIYAIPGVLLLVLGRLRGQRIGQTIQDVGLWRLMLVAGLEDIHTVLVFSALRLGSPGLIVVVCQLTPILLLGAGMLTRKRSVRRGLICTALLAGALVAFGLNGTASHASRHPWLGLGLAVVNAAIEALNITLVSKILRDRDRKVTSIAGIVLTLAGVMLSPVLFFSPVHHSELLLILGIGVAATIPSLLAGIAMQRLSAVTIGSLNLTQPFIVMGLLALYGPMPSYWQIIAILLIAGSIYYDLSDPVHKTNTPRDALQ